MLSQYIQFITCTNFGVCLACREVLHAPVLESGKRSLGGGYWMDPLARDPVERKRKVASVPPPQPPVGVAVVRRGREGAVGAAPPSHVAAPARSEERQEPPQALGRRDTTSKAAVRKVAKQKHHQHPKGGPEKTITPFSWRAGKELSDKVLSVLKQIESAKEPDQSPHSLESSAASQPISGVAEGGVGSSEYLTTHHRSRVDVKQPPSHHRSRVDVKQSPPHHWSRVDVKQSPHHRRPGEVNAAQLLADMALDPSEDEAVGERAEPRQQQAKSGRGGRRQASGPPKKPKYNFGELACSGATDGSSLHVMDSALVSDMRSCCQSVHCAPTEPVYNIPKTRHYRPEDVQQYMQKKKEERRKASDEHKKAAQRQKQLTEQRLQVGEGGRSPHLFKQGLVHVMVAPYAELSMLTGHLLLPTHTGAVPSQEAEAEHEPCKGVLQTEASRTDILEASVGRILTACS